LIGKLPKLVLPLSAKLGNAPMDRQYCCLVIMTSWIGWSLTGSLIPARVNSKGGGLWRRPKIELEIFKTNGSYWPLFEPHHYLKLPRMIACSYYVGFVDGEAVAHMAVSPRLETGGMRACRMVVMPEWQGAGVGMRFLNKVCELQFDPEVNKHVARVKSVYFHTSHPGLCAALRRDKNWSQVSQMMGGGHKGKSAAGMKPKINGKKKGAKTGYGGHFRAVQGFKMPRPDMA
jgi:GNAT superfamily N-acetyltransferase